MSCKNCKHKTPTQADCDQCKEETTAGAGNNTPLPIRFDRSRIIFADSEEIAAAKKNGQRSVYMDGNVQIVFYLWMRKVYITNE